MTSSLRSGKTDVSKPTLPEELAAALSQDPESAEGLENRLRELDAATPQAVANSWDTADEFAEEVGVFPQAARRLWSAMEAACAKRVSALAEASPPALPERHGAARGVGGWP